MAGYLDEYIEGLLDAVKEHGEEINDDSGGVNGAVSDGAGREDTTGQEDTGQEDTGIEAAGLEAIDIQAMIEQRLMSKEHSHELPDGLNEFASAMHAANEKPSLGKFFEYAQQKLQIVDVDIISAAPLKPAQFNILERKIRFAVKRKININAIVDPTIIGGLRIVVGNYVIDNSIKGQFEAMREQLYDKVYFHSGNGGNAGIEPS